MHGNNIAVVRQARGLTLAELARRVGVDRAVMSRIEHGHRIPKLPLANSIARELGTDMALLWPDFVTNETAPVAR
jgi:putative transcriptional regulator